MASSSPIKHKVYGRINKGPDMQVHVKVTKADGLELVNLRDYITSTKSYGRGIVFESAILPQVIEELQDLQRQIGVGPSSNGGEQLSLPGMENT